MKKQKGMTLMEIIVSCAVYALLALLIAETMTLVNSTMRSTNQLNRRLSYESKYADNMLTVDSSGVALTPRAVSVSINYGGTLTGRNMTGSVRQVAVDPLNTDGDNNEFTKSGGEYKMDFTDSSIVGTVYHSQVNYRFMTFDKEVNSPSVAAPDFSVIIRFVPYFTSEASSLTDDQKRAKIATADAIAANIASFTVERDGAASPQFEPNPVPSLEFTPVSDGGTEVFDHMYQKTIMVENLTGPSGGIPAGTQSIGGKLKLFIKGPQIDSANNIIGSTIVPWTDFPCEYFQYVNVGTSTTNETFYNKVLIEYNINTRRFKMIDSYTITQSIPARPADPA